MDLDRYIDSIMPANEKERRRLRQRLQELVEREGMRTLWQDGIDKVIEGKTTLSELKRVL